MSVALSAVALVASTLYLAGALMRVSMGFMDLDRARFFESLDGTHPHRRGNTDAAEARHSGLRHIRRALAWPVDGYVRLFFLWREESAKDAAAIPQDAERRRP